MAIGADGVQATVILCTAGRCTGWNFRVPPQVAVGNLEADVSIATIILIILVIALVGGFSGVGGGPFYGTGYYGGGGLGLVVVILLVLILLGRI
jgi:hypothetical protein